MLQHCFLGLCTSYHSRMQTGCGVKGLCERKLSKSVCIELSFVVCLNELVCTIKGECECVCVGEWEGWQIVILNSSPCIEGCLQAFELLIQLADQSLCQLLINTLLATSCCCRPTQRARLIYIIMRLRDVSTGLKENLLQNNFR